jgi:hypothetical protein
MQEYCENEKFCRRKIFYQKFTDQKNGFESCQNKCDNCLCAQGQRRRSFATVNATPSSQSITQDSEGKPLKRRKKDPNVTVYEPAAVMDPDEWIDTTIHDKPMNAATIKHRPTFTTARKLLKRTQEDIKVTTSSSTSIPSSTSILTATTTSTSRPIATNKVTSSTFSSKPLFRTARSILMKENTTKATDISSDFIDLS